MRRTGYELTRILALYGISRSRWYEWSNAPKLEPTKRCCLQAPLQCEVDAVLKFREQHDGVGYRKFTYMLNDANIAYLSESAVFRILKEHNALAPKLSGATAQASKEYKDKPTTVHQHWHMDIAYIKVRGTFYFLIMMLDGYSRFLLDWELMPDMLGRSVEDFVQRVKDKYPFATPTLITDNGSQFVSRDFKTLLHKIDIQHVRTRRNHPQTNGKAERWNGSVKHEAIYPAAPQSFQEAWQVLHEWAYFYNHQRLHANINFLRPADRFFNRSNDILTKRVRNVTFARASRIELNRARYHA